MLRRVYKLQAIVTFFGVLVFYLVFETIYWPSPSSSIVYFTQVTERTPAYTDLKENNESTGIYILDKLPLGDYTTLINLNNFNFILINLVCIDTSPLLLTLVHSAPSNTVRRKSIRDTWGQARPSLKVLFLLGSVENAELQAQLEDENSIHKDIVQGNFVDVYRNLTYKHVMALKYATYYCPQAKYILKTDDDVFVNMPTMMDILSYEISPVRPQQLMMCTVSYHSPVYRDLGFKWGVSFEEYKHKTYPTYCSGWAVLYSPDVVFSLYQEAQKTDFFWIDDVHVTGTLAKRRNITHTPLLKGWILSNKQVKYIVDLDKNDTLPPVFLYGSLNIALRYNLGLWEYVKDKASYYQTPRPSTAVSRSLV